MTTRDIRQAFAILCFGVSACVFFLPIVNSDLFWHLSAARRMVSTHAWPRADWLSFAMPGQAWVDFEWLCELLWYGILNIAGLWGLVIFKALFFVAAAGCLWKALELYDLSLESKALAVLAWSMAGVTANDLRPENFSLVFFILEWWMLEARRLRRKPPVPLWLLVPVYALWANLHAGFVYGLILLAFYAAVEIARQRRWDPAVLVPAALAATLINPYGWRLHEVLWAHARDMGEMQAYIREWQSPDLGNVWALPFWGALFSAFIVVLWRYTKDRKVPTEHLLALGFFSLSAANHNRLAVYFAPIGIALIACHLPSMPWARKAPWRTAGIGAAALALAVFFGAKLAPALALGPFIPRYVPDHLVRFLQEERPALKGRRMIHPWHWGGYLGYNLYPDMQVFVDGRYIFHPLLKPMRDATESPEAYRSFMDHYGIDIIVDRLTAQWFRLPVTLPGGKKIQALRPYYIAFLPEKDWALVYWDRQGEIFIRRSAFPKAWVQANEYRVFRPFDQAAAGLLVQNGAVPWSRFSAEIERFLQWSPDLREANNIRAWAQSLKPQAKAGQ